MHLPSVEGGRRWSLPVRVSWKRGKELHMPSAGDTGNTSVSAMKVSFRSLSHVAACGYCALGLKSFIVQ